MAESVTMVPFVGGSYDLSARYVSPQRTINFYPENTAQSSGARVPQLLASTPGEKCLATVSEDGYACRGMHWSSTGPDGSPCLWAVFGRTLYRYKHAPGAENSVPEEVAGAIASGSNAVSMADNGYVLAIADGTHLWVCDLLEAEANNLQLKAVTLPKMGESEIEVMPSMVAYISARFVINNYDTTNPAARNVFLFSNLNSQMPGSAANAISFEIPGVESAAAQYYSAEYSADPIDAMVVNEGRLWLLGPNSYEVWAPGANSDTGDDPFDWVSGATADIGIQAPESLAQIADYVFWLGGSASGRNGVYMASGLRPPQRVSTNALDRRIAEIASSKAGVGFCYTDEGHVFYCLTFEAAKWTIVYDVSTQLWHERSNRNWETGEDGAWIPRFPVTGFDERLFWGTSDGQIVELDHASGKMIDAATGLADKPAVRRRIGPVLWSADKRIVVRDLYVDMEVGTTGEVKPEPVGSIVPNSQNPKAMLSVSRDGGNTWGPSRWRSFGRQGNYTKTVHWLNLGWGRSFVASLAISEDFPFTVSGLRVGIEECAR